MEQMIKIRNLKDMLFYIDIEHYSLNIYTHTYTHIHTHIYEKLRWVGGTKEYPNAHYLFFQYYCYFPSKKLNKVVLN